eukprot:3760899-Pleurochrysis_carterae.AAC.4
MPPPPQPGAMALNAKGVLDMDTLAQGMLAPTLLRPQMAPPPPIGHAAAATGTRKSSSLELVAITRGQCPLAATSTLNGLQKVSGTFQVVTSYKAQQGGR